MRMSGRSRRAARVWVLAAALIGGLAVVPGTAVGAQNALKAPTVTSTVYRENAGPPGDGGEGIPGDFTFSADGDQAVVAFDYYGTGIRSGQIAADQPGGSATLTVTPTTDGPVSIEVRGIDGAGQRSPVKSYRYWIRTTAPALRMPLFQLGVPADIVFTATQDGATTFVYRLDDGTEQSLPVGEDRKGRASITFSQPGQEHHEISAWTVDATGFKSGITDSSFYVDQVQPSVDIDVWSGLVGQKRTFTVTPNRNGVVSYVYRIGDDPEVSLPAAADGSLTFEYTPRTSGFFDVRVASVNAAGFRSGWSDGAIEAAAPGPDITSAEYPAYEVSGGPGVTGTFVFSSPILPVVSYRYVFDSEPEQTVAGGSASVQWTPKKPGYHYLYVHGVTADGVVTDESRFTFQVKALPPIVTSAQFPENGPPSGKVGEPVEFTVTPALPGSHEVLWHIGFSPPQVVPVGPDGKAAFTYTPPGAFELTVSSRTADGTVSGEVTRTYHPQSS